jgi:hypothetical protein
MTRVRFLRGTALGGVGNDAYPGELRDLPAWQAAQLIAGGRAVVAPVLPDPPPEPNPEPTPEPAAAPDPASPQHLRKKGK